MEAVPVTDPASFAAGTVVGPWRVVSLHGRGSYGVVYRAESVEQPEIGPVALKVAMHPLDARFERESELLSRIEHPAVPRLRGRGWVMLKGGVPFPYIVMDWVEGVPLYTWGSRRSLSSRQVLRLLAPVARALEATHAVDGVHRDVKGDNLLVREDGTVVLMDFGSGNFRGARTLTREPPPPGTPQYQSPECLHFQWEHLRERSARYMAQPADDVYSLGVTAYRLVAGRYPPATVDVVVDEEGSRWVEFPFVPPERWVKSCPELEGLIRRMLSDEPSERGSAAEVAQALEQAAECAGSEADEPLRPVPAQPLAVRRARSAQSGHAFVEVLGLVVAMGLFMAAGAWWARPSEAARAARENAAQDGETTNLADTVDAAPPSTASPVAMRQGIKREVPKKPLQGQQRAPCVKPLVEINGGCWSGPTEEVAPCGSRAREWKGGCYVPVMGFPSTDNTSDIP